MNTNVFVSLILGVALAAGCGDNTINEGPVDFSSEGAEAVRHRVCAQDWQAVARKGAAAESHNASTLWAVSPYQVLVPATGQGFVHLNVDAKHYDWLLYTAADVRLVALEGPELTYNGAVEECPELGLVEYGVHHADPTSWLMRIDGQGRARAQFYAGLAPTDHSDPDQAGHAGHDLTGDENAPDHGGH